MSKTQKKYNHNSENIIHLNAVKNYEPETLLRRCQNALWALINMQQGRMFFWSPVLLALGIGGYFSLQVEPPLIVAIIMLFFGLALVSIVSGNNIGLRKLFLGVLVLPCIGFVAAKYNVIRIHTPIITEEIGPAMVSGVIESIEIMKSDYDARLVLSDVHIEDHEAINTPRLIRLRLRKDYNVEIGQRISALAKLMPPSEPLLTDGFDFRRYLYFQGIGAVGFIYNNVQILEQAEGNTFHRAMQKIRNTITKNVYSALDDNSASIATALINGQRAGISEDDKEALRHSGLAHILAISGLHLGLVCGALFFAARLIMASAGAFALHYPIKKYAAIFALMGGFTYMLLAGATIPTQRAMLMSGIIFIAILMDRSPFSLRLVAFAALIVLLISPSSLMSASFQLSFAAVTALVAFYDWLRPYMSEWYRNAGRIQKMASYFIGVSMTSLIAGLATAPFALYHFQQFASYGLLANMAAIPIMAFWVMPAAIVSLLLMPVGLEHWPLIIMGFGIGWIKDIAYFVSDMDGAVVRIAAFSFPVFLTMVTGLLSFILIKGHFRVIGLMVFVSASLFIFQIKQPSIIISSTHKLILLNDGEGQLKVNTTRKEKFVRQNWERSLGYKEDIAKKFAINNGDQCGDLGCQFEIKGKKIAYSTSPYGHMRDCAWADLVISPKPIRIDCAAQTIDLFDTKYKGAHSIYFDTDAGIIIKNVVQNQNTKRPWSGRDNKD